MLLETATQYSAQYFYLAPKFPRLLTYTKGMNLLMCLNGTAGGMKTNLWSNKKILKAYAKRKRR